MSEAKSDSNSVNGSFFNVAVYDGNALVRVARLKLVVGWTFTENQMILTKSLKNG